MNQTELQEAVYVLGVEYREEKCTWLCLPQKKRRSDRTGHMREHAQIMVSRTPKTEGCGAEVTDSWCEARCSHHDT